MKKLTVPLLRSEDAGRVRKQKLYLDRLTEHGIPERPLELPVTQARTVRQFQLAQLAATMARGTGAELNPTQLVEQAVRLWTAAGSALDVEWQAEVLKRGLLFLDRQDWTAHCRALIASLDGLTGAQPGQHTAQAVCKSHEEAQARAEAAVCRSWGIGPQMEEILRALFAGKAETDESRQNKFFALCSFGKQVVESGESLPLTTKSADPVHVALHHAWEPLGVSDEEAFARATNQAKSLIDRPKTALAASVPLYAYVARWLAVLRIDQLSAAKRRT